MLRTIARKVLGKSAVVAVPQLLMWFPDAKSIPDSNLPEGFTHRSFQGGDEEGWYSLLNANGQLGVWNRKRIDEERAGALVEDGQHFVLNQRGHFVACAGVYDRERKEEACWEIGWIAADPDHWGLGLGGCVLANALRFTRKLEKRHVYLLTDDFRTPAIKTYLKLGFVPDLSHPSYEDRWLKVLAALGSSYEKYTSLVKRE